MLLPLLLQSALIDLSAAAAAISLSSIADADVDRSTAVVAAAGDSESGLIGLRIQIDRSIDQLTLFRCCCNQRLLVIRLLSSIAHADAPAVATDRSTAVIGVVAVVVAVAVAVVVADAEL